MNLRDILHYASQKLDRREAETLLLDLLGQPRAWLLAHPEASLSEAQQTAFTDHISRRVAHEPLQYITGHQEFFGLDLQVSPDVLIPRPETELLVESVLIWARAQGSSDLRIADVGTGSGAIALALAANLPTANITAMDISGSALKLAEQNAARLGLLSSRVRFLSSDLLDALSLDQKAHDLLDAVVSNPPYVPEVDAPTLAPQVRDYEPHRALFAGADGLSVYRRLVPQAATALRFRGLLALEFGFGQREALREMLLGWNDLTFLDDLAGIPRIVLATRP